MFRKNQTIDLQIILGGILVTLFVLYGGSSNNVAASSEDSPPNDNTASSEDSPPNDNTASSEDSPPNDKSPAAISPDSGGPTVDFRVNILCPANSPCSEPASVMTGLMRGALNIETVPESVPKWGSINVLNDKQAQVEISFPGATEIEFKMQIDRDSVFIPHAPKNGLSLTPQSFTQTCSGTVETKLSNTCTFTFKWIKEFEPMFE
jgi:hypothetical protein